MPALPLPRAPREPEIRAALKSWLDRRWGGELALVDELAMKHGKYRIDVCALGQDLHGYEIKSDQDTLARLPDQAKQFSLVFGRMTLVVGPVLLACATALVPPWWGIVLVGQEADGTASFTELREALPNPKPNYRWVVRLLWRDELTAHLKAHGIGGYTKLKYWEIANLMLASFPPAELVALAVRVLRDRKGGPPPEVEAEAWEQTDYSHWDDHCMA